jgi:hypothetical protein
MISAVRAASLPDREIVTGLAVEGEGRLLHDLDL